MSRRTVYHLSGLQDNTEVPRITASAALQPRSDRWLSLYTASCAGLSELPDRYRWVDLPTLAMKARSSAADPKRTNSPEAMCSTRPTKSSAPGSACGRSCTTNVRSGGSGTSVERSCICLSSMTEPFAPSPLRGPQGTRRFRVDLAWRSGLKARFLAGALSSRRWLCQIRCTRHMRSVVIDFPPFQLDLGAWQLRRDAKPVPLRHKTFAFLRHLAERPGELVTKRGSAFT